jgi:hypothetical protein
VPPESNWTGNGSASGRVNVQKGFYGLIQGHGKTKVHVSSEQQQGKA